VSSQKQIYNTGISTGFCMVNRRTLLSSIGTVGTVAVAGCSSSSDNDTSSDDEEEEPETITHQIGDTFTVGEGDRAIEYTINSAETYETIGGEFTQEEPDGIFLVVQMELTNQGDESFSVSTAAYSALDSNGNSFDPDSGAGVYLDQDSRIEAEAISFDQLNPGLSTDGALVFDVPEDEEMRLRIEPTGWLDDSASHDVELGGT
jgi:hypothetical protein